jgi:hypothetical protein
MSKRERTTEEKSTYLYIRQEINNFVVLEYGYYYRKPGQDKAHWLSVMPYKPELIESLLTKITEIINHKLKNKNPVFMTHVITDIAYYLSEYAIKKPDSINRNQTAKELKQKLVARNAVLQGKFKITEEEKAARKKEKQIKAKRIHTQVNDMFREVQNDHKYHWGR